MKTMKILKAMAITISLIGSSVAPIFAQSFPEPFIKNGIFDGNIVVGATAAPSDVIGAVDIGSSLQFYMKQPADSSTSQDITINNGYKVQKSGNQFNYGDTIESVMGGTSLSEDELPAILSDGKYAESEGDNKNSITYTQELLFKPNNAQLKYTQDDDLAPKAGDYVVIKENAPLYKYSLEFDTPLEYNNYNTNDAIDDLKTSTITIQGKTYTISDVSLTGTDGKIEKLTLISGDAVMWLTQNQPILKSLSGVEHTVEVLDVTEDADACQVKIDGSTSIIDIDETRTINGIEIGVTDVRAIHAQLQDNDVCQLALGASEIILEDGKEIKVDGVELDGTETTFMEDTNGKFEGFTIDYSAKEQNDDIYLKSGQAWTDPVFNSWKILYSGSLTGTETYTLKASGDNDMKFEFANNDGRDVEIPLYYDEDNTYGNNILLGEGQDCEDIVLADGAGYIDAISGVANISINDCEGIRILASTPSGEAHMFEISNIDFGGDSNTTDIKDLTYGRTFDNLKFTAGTSTSLDLGSFGTFNINIDQDAISVDDTLKGRIETKDGAYININANLANKTSIIIDEDGLDSDLTPDVLTLDVTANSDGEIHTHADWATSSSSVESSEDSDDTILTSAIGTKVIIDDEGKDVEIATPKSDIYANVFIAPITSEITNAISGVQTYTLNKINVGAAKLDTEINDVVSQNMIVVGGPCANKVAAQVLGKTFPACGADSGIPQNAAIIKAVAQSTGKVALVVAGWEKDDTRRATRILADYTNQKWNLSLRPGNSYTITGTDLTNINVVKSS